MVKKIVYAFLALSVFSCSTVARKGESESNLELSEKQLWQIHKDIRYTIFIYEDGGRKEGLLLRWKPDSILVQPRGADLPMKIPTAGISAIKIEIGNRIWKSLAIGTIVAGAYAGVIRSWDFTDVSTGLAVAKLLGPPAILIISTAIGSGMNKYEEYRIPKGFIFDFDKADMLYRALE